MKGVPCPFKSEPMKYVNLIAFFFSLGILLSNCRSNDQFQHSCDQPTIISAEIYETTPTDHVTIQSLDIEGHCLKIRFGASGCSGDSWVVKLVDSEAIMESYPPRRNLIFSLKNEELCQAYFTREMSFDLSELKVGGDKVILQITNTGDEILYEY